MLSTFGGDSVLVSKDGVLTAVSAKDPLVKSSASQFKVIDRSLGRVALQSGNGFVFCNGARQQGTGHIENRPTHRRGNLPMDGKCLWRPDVAFAYYTPTYSDRSGRPCDYRRPSRPAAGQKRWLMFNLGDHIACPILEF
jgi:hypothetical protein